MASVLANFERQEVRRSFEKGEKKVLGVKPEGHSYKTFGRTYNSPLK